MISALPAYLILSFAGTTLATLLLFLWAHRSAGHGGTLKVGAVLCAWLLLQALLPLYGIYSRDTASFPPKIMLLGIFPALLFILLLFATGKGRHYTDSLPLKQLTWLHTIRIPVELVLYGLFLHKEVPRLMTFEGRNFDIFAGISAPLVAWLFFDRKRIGRKGLLAWNIVSLGLLLNIVVHALLSAPSPIQQFAFEQPNIALLYFPFSWLPVFIVPVVLLAQLASIRRLYRSSL
ncbi:MAG: hypothetical protein JNL13_04950 [Chitinophagaceae bacterium]|nr:hypothetical protein [Chitinophagaceae bacterium]